MLAATWMILVIGGLGGADEPVKDAGKQELEKLKGTWSIVSSVIRGKKMTTDDRNRAVIDGDKLTATRDGKASHTSTIRLDPAKVPKQMDTIFEQRDGKTSVSPGIYKLDGDILTVCSAFAGEERPAGFEATEKTMLTVMKRSDP